MKYRKLRNYQFLGWSLPSRERGLKLMELLRLLAVLSSLPSWERGLKWQMYEGQIDPYTVAPFTGAWIEMQTCVCCDSDGQVAPFTGAWIEILLPL